MGHPIQLSFDFDAPEQISEALLSGAVLQRLVAAFAARFGVSINSQQRREAIRMLRQFASELEQWAGAMEGFAVTVERETIANRQRRRVA